MSLLPSPQNLPSQAIAIPPGDRWRIMHRLHELAIPTRCPPDGSLRVEINGPLALIQVRSTVQQFAAPRAELVQWLERCWQMSGGKR